MDISKNPDRDFRNLNVGLLYSNPCRVLRPPSPMPHLEIQVQIILLFSIKRLRQVQDFQTIQFLWAIGEQWSFPPLECATLRYIEFLVHFNALIHPLVGVTMKGDNSNSSDSLTPVSCESWACRVVVQTIPSAAKTFNRFNNRSIRTEPPLSIRWLFS